MRYFAQLCPSGWIVGSLLLLSGCGSEGGPEGGSTGGAEPVTGPGNVTASQPDFAQGYLRGKLGSVSVDGEADSVDLYSDCYEEGGDCRSTYTSATVTVQNPDGSWGMTIVEMYDEGYRDQDGLSAGRSFYVTGCSGPSPEVGDWDISTEDVAVDQQRDPADPASTILTIQATFGESREVEEGWWGANMPRASASNTVTTLLRLTR
jgi:hypothetical protein